jgi:hypothetical protein
MKYFEKDTLAPYKNISGFLDGEEASQESLRKTNIDTPNKFNSLSYTLEQYLIGFASYEKNHTSIDNITTSNCRFKGHREAPKFNLALQQTLNAVFKLHKTLQTQNLLLNPFDINYSISSANISSIQHLRSQVKFQNWLQTRRPQDTWYS